MKLNNRKVHYFSSYNQAEDIGVNRKIRDLLNDAKSLGYHTKHSHRSAVANTSFASVHIARIRWFSQACLSDAKHILIRSFGWSNLLVLPIVCVLRLQGKQVVLDQPTPRKYFTKSIRQKNVLSRACYTLLHFLSGPWSMWPFSIIIQNGDESGYFLIGNRCRTLYVGNGISAARYKLRTRKPEWPNCTLHLLGIANVNNYHGYDRIIRAVTSWNTNKEPFETHFTIVGSGPYLNRLKSLVCDLDAGQFVTFAGIKHSNELYAFYERAHLAVGSIGFHRIGLKVSSVLKVREYCMVGIPFIAAGKDIDFPRPVPFRFEIDESEDFTDILRVFRTFGDVRKTFSDQDIRDYALGKLSYQAKLKLLGL